jgi:sugar phosphate isomerase/epimerase
MIFVSSSCVKHTKIKDSVIELANNGFKNIELSGGTEYYEDIESDLLELKNKYNLNYICHNYFPPPHKHFVLNLASLNDKIYYNTLEHLTNSIELSKKLGSTKFGFHAGFFIDIKVNEIGRKISKDTLYNKQISIKRFCDGFNKLKNIAGDNLQLYIENNVFSSTNAKTYKNENIFMLTNLEEYLELKDEINFNILLDIAHLKVSTNTLKLNFESQLKSLIQKTNYIHISDNDSLNDINSKLDQNSDIIKLINKENIKDKIFTLEIYDGIEAVKSSYNILEGLLND